MLPLIAAPLAQAAQAGGRAAPVLARLKDIYEQAPALDVLEALVALEAAAGSATTTRDWYVRHLEREPSLVAAAKWIAGEKLEHEQFHPQVQSNRTNQVYAHNQATYCFERIR